MEFLYAWDIKLPTIPAISISHQHEINFLTEKIAHQMANLFKYSNKSSGIEIIRLKLVKGLESIFYYVE